jgi:hypothetical protein
VGRETAQPKKGTDIRIGSLFGFRRSVRWLAASDSRLKALMPARFRRENPQGHAMSKSNREGTQPVPYAWWEARRTDRVRQTLEAVENYFEGLKSWLSRN